MRAAAANNNVGKEEINFKNSEKFSFFNKNEVEHKTLKEPPEKRPKTFKTIKTPEITEEKTFSAAINKQQQHQDNSVKKSQQNKIRNEETTVLTTTDTKCRQCGKNFRKRK